MVLEHTLGSMMRLALQNLLVGGGCNACWRGLLVAAAADPRLVKAICSWNPELVAAGFESSCLEYPSSDQLE